MAVEVIMPKQGLQMVEGTILKWFYKEGDKVEKGEPLYEMETDKLTIQIDSPASGTLLNIIRYEGEIVPVTGIIAIIGEDGENISDLAKIDTTDGLSEDKVEDKRAANLIAMEEGIPQEKDSAQIKGNNQGRIFSSPRARMRAEEACVDIKDIIGTGPEGLIIENDVSGYLKRMSTIKATPLAKKAAEINNLDLKEIHGTGTRGKITREDVEKLISQETRGNVSTKRPGRLIPFNAMRKVIAKRMVDSLHIAAQANHRMNVDMSEVLRLKDKLKESGAKVSITDIMVKIVTLALKEHPIVNSTITDEGILVLDDINIGIAVALDNGLVVPVLKNTDKLNLKEISNISGVLVQKVKSGSLTPVDMTGGTFTISNLGMYDVDSFTAIINQPESAILAVGKITKTYVVEGDQPVIKPIMTLSLTYDHRVIDGAPAAKFLQAVKRIIENPYLLI